MTIFALRRAAANDLPATLAQATVVALLSFAMQSGARAQDFGVIIDSKHPALVDAFGLSGGAFSNVSRDSDGNIVFEAEYFDTGGTGVWFLAAGSPNPIEIASAGESGNISDVLRSPSLVGDFIFMVRNIREFTGTSFVFTDQILSAPVSDPTNVTVLIDTNTLVPDGLGGFVNPLGLFNPSYDPVANSLVIGADLPGFQTGILSLDVGTQAIQMIAREGQQDSEGNTVDKPTQSIASAGGGGGAFTTSNANPAIGQTLWNYQGLSPIVRVAGTGDQVGEATIKTLQAPSTSGDITVVAGSAELADGSEVPRVYAFDPTLPEITLGEIFDLLNAPGRDGSVAQSASFPSLSPDGEVAFNLSFFDSLGSLQHGIAVTEPGTGEWNTVIATGDTFELVPGDPRLITGVNIWEKGLTNTGDGDLVGVFNASLSPAAGEFFGLEAIIGFTFEGADETVTVPPVAVAGGPYVFDAEHLTLALDGTASFDPDNPDPKTDGITSYAWSNDAGFAAGGPTPDLAIQQSGLTKTTDQRTVRLDVTDDEGDEDPDADFAAVSFRNELPSIVALTMTKRSGEEIWDIEAIGFDPDLAVNALLPGFESIAPGVSLPQGRGSPLPAVTGTSPTFKVDFHLFSLDDFGLDPVPATFTLGDRTTTIADRLQFSIDVGARPTDTKAVFLQSGSPAFLSQVVDVPTDPFNLQFDFKFITSSGLLTVFLDGVELVIFDSADSPGDWFTTAFVPIVDPALLGREDVELLFQFDGPSGSFVVLDNIVFPGLVNGDFEGGDLAGWDVRTEGAALVTVAQFELVAGVPEPASLAPFCFGLSGIAVWRRRLARSSRDRAPARRP